MNKVPHFLIIGVQRGGTTSLYDYLVRHPRIAAAKNKEVHFFDRHYTRGFGWYRRQFPWRARVGDRALTGEASPYYIFHPAVAERVADFCPNVKLMVLLRNPIERAFSHYHLTRRRGREQLSFDDAIRAEPERLAGEEDKLFDARFHSFNHQHLSYVSRGFYADQILHWNKYFALDRFLFLQSERLYAEPGAVLNEALSFLGLERSDLPSYDVRNYGGYTDAISPDARAYLKELYRPHNQRLYDLLGTDFGWDD